MSENDESVVKIPEVEYWLCIVDDEAAIRDGLVRNYNSVLDIARNIRGYAEFTPKRENVRAFPDLRTLVTTLKNEATVVEEVDGGDVEGLVRVPRVISWSLDFELDKTDLNKTIEVFYRGANEIIEDFGFLEAAYLSKDKNAPQQADLVLEYHDRVRELEKTIGEGNAGFFYDLIHDTALVQLYSGSELVDFSIDLEVLNSKVYRTNAPRQCQFQKSGNIRKDMEKLAWLPIEVARMGYGSGNIPFNGKGGEHFAAQRVQCNQSFAESFCKIHDAESGDGYRIVYAFTEGRSKR